MRTTNGGSSWSIQTTGINGPFDNLNAIFFFDQNIGFTVGNKGRILKTTNGGVGIEENSEAKQIVMFPNPASDRVTLQYENITNEPITVNIFTVFGSFITSSILDQTQNQINVDFLSNGIYLIEFKSNGWRENQKLIIQR